MFKIRRRKLWWWVPTLVSIVAKLFIEQVSKFSQHTLDIHLFWRFVFHTETLRWDRGLRTSTCIRIKLWELDLGPYTCNSAFKQLRQENWKPKDSQSCIMRPPSQNKQNGEQSCGDDEFLSNCICGCCVRSDHGVCGEQRTASRHLFSPSTSWGSKVKHRLSGLAATTFVYSLSANLASCICWRFDK